MNGSPQGEPGTGEPASRVPGDGAQLETTQTDGAPPEIAAEAGEPGDDEPEGSGPLRRCALSRDQRPISELVRFVAAPDGTILPDVAQKLPGRGVWIELSRSAVEEARSRGVFSKSLKRKVTAAPDLAERVETLLHRRLMDSLALANKAGLVVTGAEKVSVALEKHRIAALFHGSDASRDGVEKLDRKFRAIRFAMGEAGDLADVIFEELTIDEISLAIGRPNVVHAALRSGGATDRLLENARRLRRFRGPRVPVVLST